MVLSLGACTGNSQQSKDNTSDTVIDTDAGRQEAEETSEADDIKTEESGDESGQQNQAAVSENGVDVAGNDETADGVKILVVYFSATNTTKGVAENLADGLGADLYEIVPEEPYTDAYMWRVQTLIQELSLKFFERSKNKIVFFVNM